MASRCPRYSSSIIGPLTGCSRSLLRLRGTLKTSRCRGVCERTWIFDFGGGRRATAFGEPIAPRLVQHLFDFIFDRNIEKLDHGNFIQEREIKEHYYTSFPRFTPKSLSLHHRVLRHWIEFIFPNKSHS